MLLSTVEINLADLRARLSAAGVPNLWMPRTLTPVETLPVLGTGKLDLAACKRLAEA